MALINKCICGYDKFSVFVRYDIRCKECCNCGLIHQDLSMDQTTYYKKVSAEYDSIYTHDYEQDYNTARKRLAVYNVPEDSVCLDVGCGNGAFVDCAKVEYSLICSGTDISYKGPNKEIDTRDISEICYPADLFEYVFLHDVLEHIVDPKEFLSEVFRIVKLGGTVYVEIPDFHNKYYGKKHWKEFEHLWMFGHRHLLNLLNDVGFAVATLNSPANGKLVFECKRPNEKRFSILVPPGIGDAYWSLVKLPAFLERHGNGAKCAYVYSSTPQKSAPSTWNRADEFISQVPFAIACGAKFHSNQESFWEEGYRRNGRTIFESVLECDYFIAYNGILRFGRSLDEPDIDGGYSPLETDWHYREYVPKEGLDFVEMFKNTVCDDYYCFYCVPNGMYKWWLQELPANRLHEWLINLADTTKKKIVLIGAKWNQGNFVDRDFTEPCFINMIGKTGYKEAIALIKGSGGMIGFPSGISMVPTKYQIPTVLFWNKYFGKTDFWKNCVSPAVWKTSYLAIDTAEPKALEYAQKFIIDGKAQSRYKLPNPIELGENGDPVDLRKWPVSPETIALMKQGEKTIENLDGDNVQKPTSVRIFSGRDLKNSRTNHINDAIVIMCVLKSGGDYDEFYVQHLEKMLLASCKFSFELLCLTDSEKTFSIAKKIPLKHQWPGWFSKLELFRPDITKDYNLKQTTFVYFDLDTLIMDDFSSLFKTEFSFNMIRGFLRPNRRGSGVMLWRGDFSFIYEQYKEKRESIRSSGDQEIIRQFVESKGIEIGIVQDYINLYSFKRHCQDGIPTGTQIVCFHGKPRIKELLDNKMPQHETVRRIWL